MQHNLESNQTHAYSKGFKRSRSRGKINSKFLRSMQNVRHIVRTQVMNDIKEEKILYNQ